MKIAGPSGPRANAGRKPDKANGAGDGSFARHVSAAQAAGAGAVSGATSLGSVEALLAVQATGDALDGGKARDINRADDLLDRLDEIHVGLLLGRFSRGRLEALVDRLTDSPRHSGDERLSDLLDQIELRARVELAKLDFG